MNKGEKEALELVSTLKRRFEFTRGWICDQLEIKTTRLNGFLARLEEKGYIKRVNTGEYRPFVYRRIKDIPIVPIPSYKDNMKVLKMVTNMFWKAPPMRVDVDYYGTHAGKYWYKPLIQDLREKYHS